MFKRFLPIGGVVAVATLAATAMGSAFEFQTQFDQTTASLSFGAGPTQTFIGVSRGTTEFESDRGEFLRSGTFVNVSIFGPSGFQFECFRVADSAFTGGLQGASLDVTVGPGVANCGGGIKGSVGAGALGGGGGGGGGGGPTGLLQAMTLHLVWSPAGAVNHDTDSFTHTCLDFSSSSQSTRDSVRASLTGSINGAPVTVSVGPGIAGGGGGSFAFANLATAQGQFSTEGPDVPQPGCGFFKG